MDNFEEQSLTDHSISQDVVNDSCSDFIQIGDEKNCSDIFLVEITLGNIVKLDQV